MIFSDEKIFQGTKLEERQRVNRRSNEIFAHPCIQVIGERRTIIVCGVISTEGKSELLRMNGNINALRYQQQALQPDLMPFLNTHDRQMMSMHDAARPHTALTTRDWLATNNVQVFGSWPVKSPDMNPIE